MELPKGSRPPSAPKGSVLTHLKICAEQLRALTRSPPKPQEEALMMAQPPGPVPPIDVVVVTPPPSPRQRYALALPLMRQRRLGCLGGLAMEAPLSTIYHPSRLAQALGPRGSQVRPWIRSPGLKGANTTNRRNHLIMEANPLQPLGEPEESPLRGKLHRILVPL